MKNHIIKLVVSAFATFAAVFLITETAYCDQWVNVTENGVTVPIYVQGDTAHMSQDELNNKALAIYAVQKLYLAQTELVNEYATTHRTDLPYDQSIIAQQKLATDVIFLQNEIVSLSKDSASQIDTLIAYYNRMYMQAAKTGDSFLQAYYLMSARQLEESRKTSTGKSTNWGTSIAPIVRVPVTTAN